MDDAALLNLLNQARANNKREQINGMLLYRSGYFLQILEGKKKQVRALFEVIRADSRHEDVIRLATRDVRVPEFAQWSMCFHRLDGADLTGVPGFEELGSFKPTVVAGQPSLALKMLYYFRKMSNVPSQASSL